MSLQIGNQVGTIFRLAETSEAHLRARSERLRVVEPCVHVRIVPASAVTRQRGRIGETGHMLANALAEHAVKVRADTVRTALLSSVARGALGEDSFTLRRVSSSKKRSEVRSRFRAPFFSDAFNG